MQYNGTTYGIIADTQSTILSNYLTPLQDVFPNATSVNDPIYTLAYVTSTQDKIIQDALCSLWNSINANTAAGVGLDILSSTVLNLTRNDLVPSSCGLALTIGPIYSSLIIQVTVSALTGPGPHKLPSGWAVSGSVSPSPAYTLPADYIISDTGVFYVTLFSTDTSTAIPANSMTSSDPGTGVTISSITNPSTAILGSLTIPTTWQATASSRGATSPVYSLNSPETFTKAGVYNVIVYSNDISTPIYEIQLNTASDSFPYPPGYPSTGGIITDIYNKYDAILGVPPENDAEFKTRRRYYLNVEGSTYYGLEKAILDLNVPALSSVFIAETITDNYNASICIIQATVDYTGTPIVIPVGWTVYGTVMPPVGMEYKTLQETTFVSSGSFPIAVFSQDDSTNIPIGNFTTADPPYPIGGVTAVTNLSPNVTDVTVGLGQRGYTVYLDYATIPYSKCTIIVSVSVLAGPGPYYIPIGWQATGFSTTAPYKTNKSYIIKAPGDYTIEVDSIDVTTAVPASSFTGGTAVTGLTFTATNPGPAILGNANPGQFDVNDLYLQQISQTCYNYHPLGTQFYASEVGATTFIVQTPYAGYTYPVILNPFQTTQVSCNLRLVYNTDPKDAIYSNGTFDTTLLSTLATDMTLLINQYFLSKTQPDELIYSINELTEIIQNKYTGIVALVGNGGTIFSFGTLGPTVNNLVFIKKTVGYNFNLDISNFNFTAIPKELF